MMHNKRWAPIGFVFLALCTMAALCGGPAATQAPPTVAPASPTSIAQTSAPAAATATVAVATPTALATLAPTEAPTLAASPTAAATVAPPPQPDVLRVGVPFFRTLDPIRAYSVGELIVSNVCDRLLDRNATGASSPYTYKLATALTHSADGLTWTATLRPGVKFHDGTPLTADLVKGTLLASKDHSDFPPSFAAITSIDTPDDLTVVFHLNTALDLALVLAGPIGTQIVSAKGLAADKTNAKAFDAGLDACSGPYTVQSATADTIKLAVNKDYWNPVDLPGRPSTVEVRVVAAADMPAQLSSGQLDLAEGLDLSSTVALNSNPAFTLFSAPTFSITDLFLNTQRPPLNDQRVRQALAYAVDTSAIITALSQAQGVPYYPSRGPLPAGLYPYSPAAQQGAFDPAKAQQLLAAAGHPGGGLTLQLVANSLDPDASIYVPLLQQDWAKIGITVTVQSLSSTDLVKVLQSTNPADRPDILPSGRVPFHLDGAVDILLPTYHSWTVSGIHLSNYANPDFDKLVDSALAQEATNPTAALAQFAQAQQLLVDDAPAIFLFSSSANNVLPRYLAGMTYNPNYPSLVDFYVLHYPPAK